MLQYDEFLATRARQAGEFGFDAEPMGDHLWPWQRECVAWACRLGRAALFEDTGLGKTRQQLEWAHQVNRHTGRPVLILAPLAVGGQTVEESQRVGIEGVVQCRTPESAVGVRIVVTNYERAHLFDPDDFAGVVLDESSILKNYTGKLKQYLLEAFAATPYRLACTATPAPNDYLELGNHAEFLGVMTSGTMISRWFVNDQSEMCSYRLKKHAVESFWEWVSSWARCVGKPSDLGEYSDEGYDLPELVQRRVSVEVSITENAGDSLFRMADLSATGLHRERRLTATDRAKATAEIVNAEPSEPFVIWVETDYDAQAVLKELPDAVEVKGAMTPDKKAELLLGFSHGDFRVLLTKPKIAGFGMNWQHCARTVFNGPGYSYEMLYQAIRRFWRFGQKRTVEAFIVLASTEYAVWSVLSSKGAAHEEMKVEMFAASRRAQKEAVKQADYIATHRGRLPHWLKTED